MRIGSLFSGAAGLDRAVGAVFGGEVAWFAEIDKAASKVLAYHYPNVPNLGDITAVDWADVPPVDVLCGGFPCQDVSAAGKRAGIKDGTRSGLWSVFAEAIDALRPRYVVIENVRGLLSATAHRTVEDDEQSGDLESCAAVMGDGSGRPVLRAAGAVLGDLCDLGYDAQWTTLAASAVGAPHRRERVFILATDTNVDRSRGHRFPAERGESAQPSITGGEHALPGVRSSDAGIGDVADTPRNGWDEGRAESAGFVGGSDVAVSRDGDVALLPTPQAFDRVDHVRSPEKVADTDGGCRNLREVVINELPADTALLPTPNATDGHGGGMHPDRRQNAEGLKHSRTIRDYALLHNTSAWGKYEAAIRRWESIVGPAPAPTEPNKNGNPRLSAAFSEWLMGWPAGWVTDPAIDISRNDQLRIVGNGVCSQQAVAALRFLLGVATGTHTHTRRERADVTPTLLPTPCARDHKDGDSAGVHARNTPSLGAVSVYFGEGE